MSTLNDPMTHHLKKIERWLPGRTSLAWRHPLRDKDIDVLLYERNKISPDKNNRHMTATRNPGLDQTITKLTNIPERAALLGVCEDGLPFLLDLANPSPGAILVIGEAGSGKTALLRSILLSADRINTSARVTLRLIADQPDEYHDLTSSLMDVFPVEDPAISDLITNLVQTVESRKKTGPQDPASILVIDDLSALLTFLDEKAFHELYWLVRHGPRYQIWTVASLIPGKAKQIDPHFLTAFRTQLFGFMHDVRLASRLAHTNHIPTRSLEKKRQFFYQSNGEWLHFWICTENSEKDRGVLGSNADECGGAG